MKVPNSLYVKDPCPEGYIGKKNSASVIKKGCGEGSWQKALGFKGFDYSAF